MGNFYINVVVSGVATDRLQLALARLSYATILIPEIEGHSFVYADFFGVRAVQSPSELAKMLSELPGANYSVYSLNADDDLFAYEVWVGGNRQDAHFSEPGAFRPDARDSVPPTGSTSKLRAVFPFLDEVGTRRILDSEEYVFAYERHQDLFDQLRIPVEPAILDYNYIENGEMPEGIDEDSLIRIKP